MRMPSPHPPFQSLAAQKTKEMIKYIDEVGSWSAVSSIVTFAIFALETYQIQVRRGGVGGHPGAI